MNLTVGMATYDDFDGTYFSCMAVRLFHPEVPCELLVLDNNPAGKCAEPLQKLATQLPGLRYVPAGEKQSSTIRDRVMREAAGDYVVCIDCHVMFWPGALAKLMAYFEANPDTPDLIQGPLMADDLVTCTTHLKPEWGGGMFGVWGQDPRGKDPAAQPFEIGLHGLGAFACRKTAWPGFNPRLRGYGGEEGYIHEKFRRAGGRVLCLPAFRWIHRFARPNGLPYKNCWEDRIWNYLVIAEELGIDAAPAKEHLRSHIGPAADPLIAAAVRELNPVFPA